MSRKVHLYRSKAGVYKTWARPWPRPWPTLSPTLWPTQNFSVLTKIARSGNFSQNLVKRGMEPAEDCGHHETGYCATVKCDAFQQWLQWAKKQLQSRLPLPDLGEQRSVALRKKCKKVDKRN